MSRDLFVTILLPVAFSIWNGHVVEAWVEQQRASSPWARQADRLEFLLTGTDVQ